MSGLIDFHVHSFPPEWGVDPARFASENRELFWGGLMAPKQGKSLQGWVTPEQMLKQMDAAGVERVVLQGWYWEQFENCRAHNRWMAGLLEKYPDRISAYACFSSCAEDEFEEELSWVVDHGFSGIGELHPLAQGYGFGSEVLERIADGAIRHRMPVLFHVTEPVGRSYEPREETDFRGLQQFIEKVSPLPVVLAHWGGLLFSHLLNPFISKSWSHVYFDTAASPLLYDPKVVRTALEIVPSNRLLYGSDYPLKVYPQDPDQPDFRRFIVELESEAQSTDIWEQISHGNAVDLLDTRLS